MKKISLLFVLSLALVLLLCACGNRPAADSEASAAETPEAGTVQEPQVPNTMTAYRADGSAVTLEDCGDGTWKDADGLRYTLGEDGVLRAGDADALYTEAPSAPEEEIIRQDGERFEDVILLEGMEETVHYEHLRNEALGFEMDYDYEFFARITDADRERIVSVWDEPGKPENYLDITRSGEDAETTAAAIVEELSQEYDLYRDTREFDRVGSCIYIEASVIKGTNLMPEHLQMVYIIPAGEGCLVARIHLFITESEGFSRRFAYMLNTLSVMDR